VGSDCEDPSDNQLGAELVDASQDNGDGGEERDERCGRQESARVQKRRLGAAIEYVNGMRGVSQRQVIL
jgi:hypothetical protein